MAYIPDLMDNGVDDSQSRCRSSAKDMDPAALKARFGDRMAFWGGAIDAQHVLPTASPETVREHVRRNLEAWKPGGGYVFNNVHNIQAGVPPENVVALFDAAYEYGFYQVASAMIAVGCLWCRRPACTVSAETAAPQDSKAIIGLPLRLRGIEAGATG